MEERRRRKMIRPEKTQKTREERSIRRVYGKNTFRPTALCLFRISSGAGYQILQAWSRTMGSPFLHPKAFAKASKFETGPLPRKRGNGCGSVLVCRRAASGR